MRVSRTLLAFAALLLVTACSTDSPDVFRPAPELVRPAATPERGLGWSGSGNYVGIDSTFTASFAADGGIGMIGSGNASALDTTSTTNSTTERGGIGMSGSGN